MVRVAGAGERDPRPVHGVGDRPALGPGAGEHVGAAAVEVVEHERDLERVGRAQDAAEGGALEREEVRPHGRVRELRLEHAGSRGCGTRRRSRAPARAPAGSRRAGGRGSSSNTASPACAEHAAAAGRATPSSSRVGRLRVGDREQRHLGGVRAGQHAHARGVAGRDRRERRLVRARRRRRRVGTGSAATPSSRNAGSAASTASVDVASSASASPAGTPRFSTIARGDVAWRARRVENHDAAPLCGIAAWNRPRARGRAEQRADARPRPPTRRRS